MGSGPEVGRKRVTHSDLVRLIVQSISGHAPITCQTNWMIPQQVLFFKITRYYASPLEK
jgi:hypothetical protein